MSVLGGKTFSPVSTSRLRNFLRSRNSLLVTSSLSTHNHDSCRVSISSLRSSFCSGVSLATHASLSNLTGVVSAAVGAPSDCEDNAAGVGLGCPKNAVMDPLAFGFLAASAAISAALRFRDMAVFG